MPEICGLHGTTICGKIYSHITYVGGKTEKQKQQSGYVTLLKLELQQIFKFVQIFIRILVFRFDLFALGVWLHGIYVMYSKITLFDAILMQIDLYNDFIL